MFPPLTCQVDIIAEAVALSPKLAIGHPNISN
jgi:hypothetical protein